MTTPPPLPDSPQFAELVHELRQLARSSAGAEHWPIESLRCCGRHGVFAWFVPREFGGAEWSPREITAGYLQLARACLTTTFVITQWAAACARVVASTNEEARGELLPSLARGERFTTVAISHLSTSRRHLGAPILRAIPDGDCFVLDGYSAWVTGAIHADVLVIGATLDDGREILVAAPSDLPGLEAETPQTLVGLTASDTGLLRCRQVRVSNEWLLAGPIENVMRVGGAGTGGLQTSTLAVGLTDAALEFAEAEAERRTNLRGPIEALRREWTELRDDLLQAAGGGAECSPETLRARANSLVLRATQAALVAAKGTGYLVGHPAGRWCREALFFLVWSCPQGVSDQHLCELAGLGGGDDE